MQHSAWKKDKDTSDNNDPDNPDPTFGNPCKSILF